MIGPAGTFAAPQLTDEFTEEDESAFMADISHLPVLNKEHTTILEMSMGLTITVGSPSKDETHLPFKLHDFGPRGKDEDLYKNATTEEAQPLVVSTDPLVPEPSKTKCGCGEEKGKCIY